MDVGRCGRLGVDVWRCGGLGMDVWRGLGVDVWNMVFNPYMPSSPYR